MREQVIGIYCIENIKNRKKYIGQSQDCMRRMQSHKNMLRKNTHSCIHLQHAWNNNGEVSFEFYMIEECYLDQLNEKEIHYISELNSHSSKNGYNISWGGDANMRGRKHTEEAKEKIRKNHFDNSGENNPNFGKSPSKETRKKNSDAILGEKNYWWGKVKSKEIRDNISKGRLGLYNGENSPLFAKKHKNATSQYYGVHANKTKGYTYWRAEFSYKMEMIRIGNYSSEIDAAIAYDKYVVEHNLPHPLNFPNN